MPRDEEILRRRARFVSAALVLASGCTRNRDGASPLPDSEAVKAAPSPPMPAPPPRVPPPPDRPALSAKVSAAGEPARDAAIKQIETLHASIEKLAGSIPAACELSETSCHARFKAFAEQIAKLDDDVYALHPPRCPAKLPDDIAVEKLRSEHRSWLDQWLRAIDVAAEQMHDAGTAWHDLRTAARAAYPHPCLKFYCP